LDEILAAVLEVCSAEAGTKPAEPHDSGTSKAASALSKPVLVKVAPDLSLEALDEILQLADSRRLAGIVATNTTISRPQTNVPELQQIYAQEGGLSGLPLKALH
jgi:dihydroorotate dehydrogenase